MAEPRAHGVREKVLTALAVMAVMGWLAGSYGSLLVPGKARPAESVSKINEDLAAARARNKELESRIKQSKARLAPAGGGSALAQIADMARASGVGISEITLAAEPVTAKPELAREKGGAPGFSNDLNRGSAVYGKNLVTVRMEAGYRGIATFITLIAESPMALTVNKVAVQRGKGDYVGKLDADIELEIYSL
ncbi:MAG: hypothetical protein HZB29_04220 [Nitrospinae bacterium]|nr:hypothetical protein [Nitrospinota bacterium]